MPDDDDDIHPTDEVPLWRQNRPRPSFDDEASRPMPHPRVGDTLFEWYLFSGIAMIFVFIVGLMVGYTYGHASVSSEIRYGDRFEGR